MVKVTIEAPSEVAGRLAQMFESEGLRVSWEGPLSKGVGGGREVVQLVYWVWTAGASGVVGGASFPLAKIAVQKIRERFPRAKVIRVEDSDTVGRHYAWRAWRRVTCSKCSRSQHRRWQYHAYQARMSGGKR
jgi:hypothetical protein